jgi:hypothetical protein
MSEAERKRRGPLLWLADRSRRFWIITVMSLPVLYVGSFGPACWWFSKQEKGVYHRVALPYWPIGWAAKHGPRGLSRAIWWYATLSGKWIIVPADFSGTERMRMWPTP